MALSGVCQKRTGWDFSRSRLSGTCLPPCSLILHYLLMIESPALTLSHPLFHCHLLSQGHGLCSHVHVQHFLHVTVMVANILQGVISTCHGISFLCRMLIFSLNILNWLLDCQVFKRPEATLLFRVHIKSCYWRPSNCLFLQSWVYNVTPWLAAIPSALGGGYISDFLINRGINKLLCKNICCGWQFNIFE